MGFEDGTEALQLRPPRPRPCWALGLISPPLLDVSALGVYVVFSLPPGPPEVPSWETERERATYLNALERHKEEGKKCLIQCICVYKNINNIKFSLV